MTNNKNNKEVEDTFKMGNEKYYRDLEGVTLQKLNIGLWYIEHKKQLLYLLYGILITISVVTWPFFFYYFGEYFIQGRKNDEKMIKEMVNTNGVDHNFVLQIGAQDLKYYNVKVLKQEKGKYDFVVKIKNPNKKYYAYFQYDFSINNKTIGPFNGFIYPQEEKYLVALKVELPTTPRQAKFVLEEVKWKRINPHNYRDWPNFYHSHFDFIVKDKKFTPAKISGLSEKIPINNIEFSITNNTAYNYWNVNLVILLLSRNKIVGVDKYNLYNFVSGENRYVQISWPGRIGYVDDIKIIPEVDIINKNVYMPFK